MPNFNKLKNISGNTSIVGVAESDQIGKVPEKSPLALHAEAASNALNDAGLKFSGNEVMNELIEPGNLEYISVSLSDLI